MGGLWVQIPPNTIFGVSVSLRLASVRTEGIATAADDCSAFDWSVINGVQISHEKGHFWGIFADLLPVEKVQCGRRMQVWPIT